MIRDETARPAFSPASLDPANYAAQAKNPAATVPAVAVVVTATLLAALGGYLWALVGVQPPPAYDVDLGYFLTASVVVGSVLQVAFWFAWVAMTWAFLRYIYLRPEQRFLPLVRTMGFAFAPMALQLLLVFPVLEFPIGLIALGATAGLSVLAVQAATDVRAGQAALATLAGFALFVLALGQLGTSDADLAPGIFAIDPNAYSIRVKLALPDRP